MRLYATRLLAIVAMMVGFHAISQAQTFQVGQTWDVQAAQLNPTQEIINGTFTVDSLAFSDPSSQENGFNSTLHFQGVTLTGSLDDQYGNSLLFLDFRNGSADWSAQIVGSGSPFGGQYNYLTPASVATNGIFVATLRPVPLPPSILVLGLGLTGLAIRLQGRRPSARICRHYV